MEDAIARLAEIIATLAKALATATILLVQILLVVLLGFLVAVFYALPWLIRAGALLTWFYGVYRSVLLTMQLYAPFTPPPPLIALQVFVALVQFGALLVIFKLNPRLAWGALYLIGGLSLWLSTHFIPQAILHPHADLILRLLPSTIWASLLIYITIRAKRRQAGKMLELFNQAALGARVSGWLDAIDAFGTSLLQAPETDEGGGV